MLSENGKKASELTATSPSFCSHDSRSSVVKVAGTSSKLASKSERSTPDFGTWPLQRRSIALLEMLVEILRIGIECLSLPLLWSLDSFFKFEAESTLVESHPPVVSLVTS
jgi:hypothetical protein